MDFENKLKNQLTGNKVKEKNRQSSCMKYCRAENCVGTTLYLVDMYKGISLLYITRTDFYGDSMNKFQYKTWIIERCDPSCERELSSLEKEK